MVYGSTAFSDAQLWRVFSGHVAGFEYQVYAWCGSWRCGIDWLFLRVYQVCNAQGCTAVHPRGLMHQVGGRGLLRISMEGRGGGPRSSTSGCWGQAAAAGRRCCR
eukprot:9497627-Pyramimonas_sp.AAC.1